jgi:hypothetical protein
MESKNKSKLVKLIGILIIVLGILDFIIGIIFSLALMFIGSLGVSLLPIQIAAFAIIIRGIIEIIIGIIVIKLSK